MHLMKNMKANHNRNNNNEKLTDIKCNHKSLGLGHS